MTTREKVEALAERIFIVAMTPSLQEDREAADSEAMRDMAEASLEIAKMFYRKAHACWVQP